LKAVEERYGATGELPDGKAPKVAREPKPKVEKAPKAPKPTTDQLATRIVELKTALDRGDQLDRDSVVADVKRFELLTIRELHEVLDRLQFPKKAAKKGAILEDIVTHIYAVRSATDRVKL
jgi:hypothetical protein